MNDLNPTEAAALIGCTRVTVYRLANTGVLAKTSAPNEPLRISLASIRAYLQREGDRGAAKVADIDYRIAEMDRVARQLGKVGPFQSLRQVARSKFITGK